MLLGPLLLSLTLGAPQAPPLDPPDLATLVLHRQAARLPAPENTVRFCLATGLLECRNSIRGPSYPVTYFGARYYSAPQGRFISPDQPLADQHVGDPQSWNLYTYVRNNPVRHVDPTGEGTADSVGGTAAGVGKVLWNLNPPVALYKEARQFLRGPSAYADYKIGQMKGLAESARLMAVGMAHPGDVNDQYVKMATSTNDADQWALGETMGQAFTAGAVAGATLKMALPAAAEEAAIQYSPINPGPLPDAIAGTFRGGSYTARTLGEATTLYRAYGGTAGQLGSFWTRTAPSGPLQAGIDLGLNPQWGNTAAEVATIRVPAGTTIFEGAAEAQGALVGGGSQVFIPTVNPAWLVP